MRGFVRRGVEATGSLLDGLQTALPALFGVLTIPVLLLVLPVLPEAVHPVRALADAERARLGKWHGEALPRPYRPSEGGRWRQGRAVLRDPATWRDLVWLYVHGGGGPLVGLFAVVLWPAVFTSVTMPLYWWLMPMSPTAMLIEVRSWPQALTLPFAQAITYAAAVCWLLPLAERAQVWFARSLLRPTARTWREQRIEQLAQSRTEALESHGAELRRIERDLHDGVQSQLVSVAVRLGLLERALSAESATALPLLQEARTTIEDSMSNLRGVIRGIYPPILADRGLQGAVQALAGGQRVPVAVRVRWDNVPRLAAPVETAVYFVVAESLTNVAKHSTADHAEVTLERDMTQVRVVVSDNGQGGVEQTDGTGLTGIQRRVAALDGSVHIVSPANEGTTIEVLLPCE